MIRAAHVQAKGRHDDSGLSRRPSRRRPIVLRLFLGLSLGLSLVVPIVSLPGASFATGFGVYFDFIHAEGDIDPDIPNSGDLDFDANKYGFGFALDTNLAQNRVFNYRLNLGYQRTNRHFDDYVFQGNLVDLGHLDADGVSINNVFGFGVWTGPHHRLWVGPTIRLGLDVYDTETSNLDIFDFSAGVGASIGLNIHTSEVVTIGLTAGYQYLSVSQVVHYDGYYGNDETRTYDGHEHAASANVTLFFRTGGDRFQ